MKKTGCRVHGSAVENPIWVHGSPFTVVKRADRLKH
jgi:hypothetical protein